MSDDLKYVIKMVNSVVIAFIALIGAILSMVGVALSEEGVYLDLFSVLVISFFFGVVIGTVHLLHMVDLKREQGNDDE